MTDTTKQIEQALNEAYPVAASSIGEVEDRAIEMRGFRKGWLAARATPVSPAQTIDTPEFGQLATAWSIAEMSGEMEPAISAWQALVAHIDARLQAAPARPQSDLHSVVRDILALQPNSMAVEMSGGTYREGYRDACHNAAELVAASVGAQVAGEPVGWAMYADNGNVRTWFSDIHSAKQWADVKDIDFNKLTPLYTAPVPAPAAVPHEMVPLRMEFEPGYPEDVAFGSQMQMGRLKKWLDKYFAILATQAERQPQPAAQAAVQAPVPWNQRTAYTRDSNKMVAMEEEMRDWRARYAAPQGVEAQTEYPYDALFRAIGDAVTIQGEAKAISVKAFVQTLNANGYRVEAQKGQQ